MPPTGGLVLSRNLGQRVFIDCPDGSRLVVRYHAHDACGQIKLHIIAPTNYAILREEVELRGKAGKG